MRWQAHQYGDIRERRAFLFFPKRIGRETRWLEWARWEERKLMFSYTLSGWDGTRWIP